MNVTAKVFVFLFYLSSLFGCSTYNPYFEGTPTAQPAIANIKHKPSSECTQICIEINRIRKLEHSLNRIKALSSVIDNPRLSCHEQLYIIDVAVYSEIFGTNDVFIKLAQHPYLRESARSKLLYHTNRLAASERIRINQLLQVNKGVPDELTKLEKLWSIALGIDQLTIFELHKRRMEEQDILTLLYLKKYAHPNPEVRRKSDWTIDEIYYFRQNKNDKKPWYRIIIEDLKSNPGELFIPLPPGTQMPNPFSHLYELYWIGLDKNAFLTNDEVFLVIKLKIIKMYYNLDPIEAMNSLIVDNNK